jgi:hypothetical protein
MFYFDSEWLKFCPPVDILPVKLIVTLLPVNFLLARPFSFFDHFFSFIRFKLYTFLFAIYLNCVISWLAWSFLVRSLFITQYSLPARRFVAWYSVCPSLNISVRGIRLFPEILVCVSRGCVIKQFNLRLV